MNSDEQKFSGMYFPFSRPIEVESLKQMLLIFDSIAFLDPVEDDEWRMKLLLDMEKIQGGAFRQYLDVDAALPLLIDEGVIEKFSPEMLNRDDEALASAASLSDLLDPSWVDFANTPQRYNLPHSHSGNKKTATWQVFKPKLPDAFIEGIRKSPELSRQHIFQNGGEHYAWTVSYAAGSSIASNLHLSAAEKLGLAPVTDSLLHHRLLLHKAANRAVDASVFDDDATQRDTSGIVTSMLLRSLVPKAKLNNVSFEQILRFREETKGLRIEAISEITRLTHSIDFDGNPINLIKTCRDLEHKIRSDLENYRNEMQAIRDKFWPQIVEIPQKRLISGSFAAIGLSLVGGPGAVLLGSIAAAALSLLKIKLDTNAERKRIERSKAPTVAFLTKLEEFR